MTGSTAGVMMVDAGDTETAVVPEEPAKLGSPKYVAVIVSEPPGVFVAEHDAEPEVNEGVMQSRVEPAANSTAPVGSPPELETEAE
jgi:hypothetical protein